MMIKSIELTNFRQFIGHQKIDFSTDKERNVTVLIGINTSGKTTFVRAFEWILYGKIGFEDSILLNQNVIDNMTSGEIQRVIGKLVVEHGGKEYEITRTYTYTCTGKGVVRQSLKGAEICYLQPDGQTKTRIESEVQPNIERILPEGLSNYFFFGGERVESISSRDDIESSVKGLMGLDVLSNAMTHLRSVINKFKKNMDYSGDSNAERIQQNLDSCLAKSQILEGEQHNILEQITYYQEEKEKYAALLRANKPTEDAQKRRDQLDRVIESLKARITKDKDDLVNSFNQDSFVFFGMPLLKKTAVILLNASDDIDCVPDMNSNTIDYIIKRGYCICGTKIDSGTAAEQNILAEKTKQPPESIGAVVRRFREQAADYLTSAESYHGKVFDRFQNIRSNQRELGFRIDELETVRKELAGQKDVSDLEQQYRNAEKRLKEFEEQRYSIIMKLGACKKDIANFERSLEAYGKANAKNAKLTKYIDYATATLEWVQEAYSAKESIVRSKLEEKVNTNFAKIYHGSRTIIIDEKYRVKYLDITTEESPGLKAVKSFAFVSGLVDLAKDVIVNTEDSETSVGPQYYPLVLDAPFSNVDEIHIQNVCRILPDSAEQVIIAIMKKDWDQAEIIMAPFAGKCYEIIKDSDADGKYIETSTHIR